MEISPPPSSSDPLALEQNCVLSVFPAQWLCFNSPVVQQRGGAHSLTVLNAIFGLLWKRLILLDFGTAGVFFFFSLSFLAALRCFPPLWLNPLFFLSTFSLFHLVFSFSLSSSQILLESSVRHPPTPAPPQFHAHHINPGEAAAMPFSAPHTDIVPAAAAAALERRNAALKHTRDVFSIFRHCRNANRCQRRARTVTLMSHTHTHTCVRPLRGIWQLLNHKSQL